MCVLRSVSDRHLLAACSNKALLTDIRREVMFDCATVVEALLKSLQLERAKQGKPASRRAQVSRVWPCSR
jgi:hypothetical protein